MAVHDGGSFRVVARNREVELLNCLVAFSCAIDSYSETRNCSACFCMGKEIFESNFLSKEVLPFHSKHR